MSKRWLFILLVLLAIIGWGSFASLMFKINILNKQFQLLEVERDQLKKEISELKKRSFENIVINIGVTAADDYDYNRTKVFFEKIVEKDVNEFCFKLGYDVKFKFIVKNNEGLVHVALQNLQEFRDMGIYIIIGHPWSAQCYVSMPYVNNNDMMLFSASSRTSQLARPGDNLLRMYPVETSQGRVIAEMMRSLGIEAVIVMQFGSVWGDEIYKVLEEEFIRRGGVIIGRIRYDPECTDFRVHLKDMEDLCKEAIRRYGGDHVAVMLLSFSEGVKIIKQARGYPSLYGIYWFGTDETANLQALIDEASEEAAHLKLFSPIPAPVRSQLYLSLNERYIALFSEPLDLEMASKYDIAWIIVKAIVEARTTDVRRLLEVIPSIASMTFGASGWCKLDENGDRETADYEIYGYGYLNNTVAWIKYGLYDGLSCRVSWFHSLELR